MKFHVSILLLPSSLCPGINRFFRSLGGCAGVVAPHPFASFRAPTMSLALLSALATTAVAHVPDGYEKLPVNPALSA